MHPQHTTAEWVTSRIDAELLKNPDHKDMRTMLEVHPLRITLLSPGTLARYQEQKLSEGADLGHLKPNHMSPADSVVRDLLRHSGQA